jgi:4-hydroxybutyrate CoA-transferase
MNNWKNIYSHKLVSAEQALRSIKSRGRVVIANACGRPPALVEALVARAPGLRDVEIVHMLTMGTAKYAQSEMAKSFRHGEEGLI